MRSLVAIAVAAPWVVWALVRTLGFEVPYPFVALLAFTPYAALSSPLPVVVGLLLRRWVIAGVAAVAMLAFAVALVPRAVGGPEPEAQGPRLVVMTSNLYLGQADARAVLRIAREHDVDVWSLQELRPRLMRRLDRAGAARAVPRRVLDPREGASGSGVLSRAPLARSTRRPTARATRSRRSSCAVRRRAAGADQGRPPGAARERDRRAVLAGRARRAAGSDGRGDVQILAGDFNATLDHPELRALLDRGYTDAADAVGKGFVWTWPAPPARRALPLTIDHVLVDQRVEVEQVTVVRVPGSDHRAVIAALRLPR